MERKTLPLAELKIAGSDGEPGSFEGYGSVFGRVDSYGDTVDPGAFSETIPTFLSDGFVAWGHDWLNPVATPTVVREDGKGLFLSADFHSHPDAQRARVIASERLARGKSMGLSIGYEALEWEMRQVPTPIRGRYGELTDRIRALTKIKLYEVSLVTVPAESAALVTDAKAFDFPFEHHCERVRVAVQEWVARAKSGSDMRAHDGKEGRAISSARRERIASMRDSLHAHADELDALLKETEPQKAADPRALYLDFQKILATHPSVARGV